VNIFYKVADFAAALFAKFPEYEAFIEEQHHSRKKDAPSGTALKLKEIVSGHVEVGDVAATRAGNIPGTHRVGFDGPADQVTLVHAARSREGFALGALMAAEWIAGKNGVFEFSEIIGDIIKV
ncbi:MAG: dihydrodipicolinate reductase, partial [Blastocatellia bacterium]|nr:dihydrodipicolinate reductase [Blastocatellia bacterium]